MIDKECGRYFAACDDCDETSPSFETWDEVLKFVKDNWHMEKVDGEWVHICSECHD